MDTNSEVLIERASKQNRPALQAYASFIGKSLFSVKRDNVDPLYNKKKHEGKDPVLMLPLRKCIIEEKIIHAFDVIVDANDHLFIVFNSDKNLRFPLELPKFVKVDSMTLREALDKFEKTNETTWFKDLNLLVDEVSALNKEEARRAKALAEEFTRSAMLFDQLQKSDEQMLSDYNRELGIETDVEISLKITEEKIEA
jgi:hypothetical protein